MSEPTPEQIRKHCQQLQSTWNPSEELARRTHFAKAERKSRVVGTAVAEEQNAWTPQVWQGWIEPR